MAFVCEGLWVALVTPFDDTGDIDLAALKRLIAHVKKSDADGLVVLGIPGEPETLREQEREQLILTTLEAAGETPVLVGTGHSATRQTCLWTRRAQQLGAAGALVVAPYFSKPMPWGILEHYRAVADSAPGFPLVVVNSPARTGVNLEPDLVQQLWGIADITAFVDCSEDIPQLASIARSLPDNKRLLTGEDPLALAAVAVGAHGIISCAANLVPAEIKAMLEAVRDGDIAEAQRWLRLLTPLFDALVLESNPIPLKAGLQLLGLTGSSLRLPLTPAESSTVKRVEQALDVVLESF